MLDSLWRLINELQGKQVSDNKQDCYFSDNAEKVVGHFIVNLDHVKTRECSLNDQNDSKHNFRVDPGSQQNEDWDCHSNQVIVEEVASHPNHLQFQSREESPR